ncbi:hypothetical protein J2S53_001368 [Actinopolyspora lacussalsi]|nr:hypothetical protein [Actinopolyspora lacussalsi]
MELRGVADMVGGTVCGYVEQGEPEMPRSSIQI